MGDHRLKRSNRALDSNYFIRLSDYNKIVHVKHLYNAWSDC